MTIRRLFAAVLLIAATACASAGGSQSGEPRGERNLISRAELEERSTSNLYDIIRALRPNWLRAQASGFANAALEQTGPIVYVDGQVFGEVEGLRSIVATSVEYVRFLSASQAQNRYSMAQARPVIDVTSRRR